MKIITWKEFVDKYMMMITVITLFLVCGTANTILPKTAYQTESEGRDGDVHLFVKPLFFNWAMFVGMTMCLFIYIFDFFILPLFKKPKHYEQLESPDHADIVTENKKENDENKNPREKTTMKLKGYLMMTIPACCDFLATYLMNFGLIFVASSIFQMMKGSIIIFTAILSVFYRKHKMYVFEMVGVAIIVVSLVVIGSAAFCPGYSNSTSSLDESEESTDDWYYTLIGIILIFIGQFLQALQTVIEEQLLHDINAPVNFVVGLEGLYGLIICSCLMPIMNMDWVPEDLKEDTKDTFIMLGNNPSLIGIVITHICVTLVFNLTGMIICDVVNAMVRNIMEPLRMITIWICSVFLYYVVDEAIGEKVGYFTILEVLGFLLLSIGFLMYTKVIRFPKCFKYPVKDDTIDLIEEEREVIIPENETTEEQVPSVSGNSETPLLRNE